MKQYAYTLLTAIWLCLSTLNSHAQTIGQWNVYPSYMNATQCVALGNMVYTRTEGNLFAYDTEDESVTLFNRLEQLNDVRISQIAASNEAKRIIIVYENCNIDLMDNDGNVINICALKDKSMSGKTINAVHVTGTTAYICTGFGFLTVDMKEGVIRDTYNIGIDVKGILLKEGKPYIATSSKSVYTTKEDENWHLNASWITTSEVSKSAIDGQVSEYVAAGGILWHAEGMKGLMGYKDKDGKKEAVAGPIQPNSPVRDLFYRMNYVGDRLLVAGGTASYSGISHAPTLMYFENNRWEYLDDSYLTSLPSIRHRDITHIAQDPQNKEHIFAGSFRTGLYEFLNGKFVKLYNCDNSPISMIRTYGNNYCSAMGVTFDNDNNLWLLNAETDTIIRILQPNGKWQRIYYEEIAGIPTPDDYLFTTSGVNFIVSRRVDERGFFGFHTNGTLGNTRDDRHVLRTFITNQDGTTYDLSEFYCMTEDLTGKVWCGTSSGLFVINDPTTYFNDDFRFEQIKIARNDGSNLADYLLNGVSIRCIAVDGANRKWIGTNGNGIYLISADGQEMLQHFMAEDSPILSNNIQSIAIHHSTGLVMIGTDVGLCSYMSDATEAAEELKDENIQVYPNPVSPDYNGPITIKGLTFDSEVKICSASGQLVWSGISNGGTFTWDGRNKMGRRVASGVYHVIANNAEGKKAIVSQIVVIK